MTLSTYSELKAEVIDFSHRNDVANKIDTFIKLAEQEMYNNSVEPLAVRDQEYRATADTSTTARFLALPTGFTEMRRLLIDDKSTNPTQYELKYFTPEVIPVSSTAGVPGAFTVTSQIEFDRVPDAVYNVEMQYYAKPTALSASNTTNDTLTNFPLIYLSGCLWALYRWAKDVESAQVAYSDFIQAIKGANLADDMGSVGPAPTMRNERPVV